MTQTVIIKRAIDNVDSIEPLDAALRAALGAKCFGLGYHDETVTVYLSDDAKSDEQNTAVQLVQTFDLSIRTPEQVKRAEAAAEIADFKAQAETVASDLQDAAADIGKGKTTEEVLTSLTDQVARLTTLMAKVLERLKL